MKMTEYCDVLNVKLRLEYRHDLKWRARIDNAEIKENRTSVCLQSVFGVGDTPEKSMENYMSLIKGKYLVIDAGGTLRREYLVPTFIGSIEQ